MQSAVLELPGGPADPSTSTARAVAAAWRDVGWAVRLALVAVAAGAVLTTAWWVPGSPRAIGAGGALVVLSVAALVDAAQRRLPDRLVALAAVPVVATLAAAWSPALVRTALAGAALVGVPLLVTHLVAPAGMGFGDVKAGVVLGAAVGLVDADVALLALVLGLAAGAAWGLLRRVPSLPLGPFLVAGAAGALLIGRATGLDGR